MKSYINGRALILSLNILIYEKFFMKTVSFPFGVILEPLR